MNNKTMDTILDWMVSIAAMFIGFFAGYQACNFNWRIESIKSGHAEYYLDDKYERNWRWLSTCVSKDIHEEKINNEANIGEPNEAKLD